MISKTKLKSRVGRKTNPEIQAMIILATKNAKWIKIAQMISGSTKQYKSVNLGDLDKFQAGDTIIVVGKVLASGDLTKKLRICALGISASAKEKLKKTKSEYVSILDEIKLNPKAEGIKII